VARLTTTRARLTATRARLVRAAARAASRWYPTGPTAWIPRSVAVARRHDLPPRLHPSRLYLVGTPAKWAVFRCPCGTGHQIDLNLAHSGQARWTITLDSQHRPSLRPSIDVKADRRCHFWLTAGEVRWCNDSDRSSWADGRARGRGGGRRRREARVRASSERGL